MQFNTKCKQFGKFEKSVNDLILSNTVVPKLFPS